MEKLKENYMWIIKVLNSCKTMEHLIATKNLIFLFKKISNKNKKYSYFSEDLLTRVTQKINAKKTF